MAELKKQEVEVTTEEKVESKTTEDSKAEEVKEVEVSSKSEASEKVVSSEPAPKVVYVEKKGGFGWGKCCLAGCIVMFLCCICTIIFAIVAPNVLISTVMGGKKVPDASLTRIASMTEYSLLSPQMETMDGLITTLSNGDSVLKLDEKQAIAFVFSMFGPSTEGITLDDSTVSKLGVKFTPNKAKVEVDIGLFFNTLPAEIRQNLDPKIFDGMNVSASFSTTADNTGLKLDDFSTGNTILDSIIGSFKQQFIDSVEQSMQEQSTTGDSASGGFKKYVITQGYIELTMPSTPTE